MTAVIACSHGTRFPEGRATVAALVALLAERMPGTRVEQAFVDVEQPEVAEVAAHLAAEGPAVVVPLLLSTGFHTKVDIAAAVAPHARVHAARPLGPHPLLVDALVRRLIELPDFAGFRDGDHVVLAAAGSSDPEAAEQVEEMAALLRPALPVPVTVGYGAGSHPRLSEAVAAARAAGARRVVAASYVLAPGHFAGLVERSGADLVSAPLGTDPAVLEVVAQRIEEATLVTA
ncbi:sirohydrochlorin chelatase [Brachybacterium sp. YJGR34]|uniref:sirohydrochlorin chelatase n=1 Tax=Brachybacterium sp. YJGR34 TaxID=2059911 RepID=UPI000E0A9437|nr:CbiX/SirB N-terminal domain-containing protein [Brachybacterium sp. YJGR34]